MALASSGASRALFAALRILAAVATLLYPLLVWRGLLAGSPRRVALVLLCVLVPAAALRWFTAQDRSRPAPATQLRELAPLPLVSIFGLVLAALLDDLGLMLLVPVAINAVLLLAFGSTLRSGSTPMIERFARLQVPDLDADQRAWCRLWTWIWCAFFVANGAVAAALAFAAPLSWWAFYTGLLSYLLIGALFASEWLLRRRRFPEARSPRESEGA